MEISIVFGLESNFESPHLYVIQGFNGKTWQDSKHGANDPQEAKKFARENADKIAMPHTKLRVVPVKGTLS